MPSGLTRRSKSASSSSPPPPPPLRRSSAASRWALPSLLLSIAASSSLGIDDGGARSEAAGDARGSDGSTRDAAAAVVRPHREEEGGGDDEGEAAAKPEGCGLYLADSSIPGAGLGVYTSVHLPAGTPVGPPDVLLRLLDFELHNDYRPDASTLLPTRDYAWDARRLLSGRLPNDSLRSSTIVPGLGMACNCHFGLVNVVVDPTSLGIDDFGLSRAGSPAAGAFTYYGNVTHVASVDVAAGSELFHDYGEAWFRRRGERFEAVPFAENYREADGIVRAVDEFLREEGGAVSGLAAELWEVIRAGGGAAEKCIGSLASGATASGATDTSPASRAESLVRRCRFDDPRTGAALPPDVADVPRAAASGTARHSVPNLVRPPPWLVRNGLCMDKLVPGPSTVPHAGRGAFAARSLREGEMIAPMPLIHISDGSVLDMYVLAPGGAYGQPRKVGEGKVARQLLVNYCYGHRESTLLLIPYSSAVNLVNHGGTSPNARVRWSSSPHHQGEWLNRTVDDLRSAPGPVLMMELAATRDVRRGEEVLINYGDDWDGAWRRHKERWEAPPGSDSHVSAVEMNRGGRRVKTWEEEGGDPYPSNVAVRCYFSYDGAGEEGGENSPGFNDDEPAALADLGAEELGRSAAPWRGTTDPHSRSDDRRPCRILSRETGSADDGGGEEESFIALIGDRTRGGQGRRGRRLLVRGVPREAIVFVDRPYESDVHLAGAFRHEIGIPDDMFPPLWRNL